MAEARETIVPERTSSVLLEVAAERARQDAKWGGPTHDDVHSLADWNRYLREHEVRAEQALAGEPVREGDDWRTQMLRVAALAVAAIESADRGERLSRSLHNLDSSQRR